MFKKYIAMLGLTVALAAPALADTTPQALPFAQDWTNVNLITANDDWSGVAGITGYKDDISISTGSDPQTVLGAQTTVNVIADNTSPGTLTSGGVLEAEIGNPVVALQGSGSADAPNIVIHIVTTGKTGIQISYNLRDIDDAADNAVQPVALQYRIGSTGDFTNVASGFVADASEGPSLATKVTPVSVTLPTAVENQAEVQIRIITANAGGSDEWIGIDDISITSGAAATPATVVDSTNLGSFGNLWPVPAQSAAKTLTVSGTALTGNITVTAPAGFEVKKSTDPTYSASVALVPASGTVAATSIDVRANATVAGLAEGDVVVATASAPDKNVKVVATANNPAGLFLYDDVDFAAGDLVPNAPWEQFQSGSAIQVLPGSLTFTGLGRAATLGNKIQALGQAANGQGVVAPFAPLADGSVYYSYLLNVPTGGANIGSQNPQLTGFREGSGTFTRGALFMMAGTSASTYRLGHSFYSFSSALPVGVDFNVDQTYLIVIKYSFNGAADDESKLFVFSASDPFPTTEPATAFQTATKQGTETDSSSYLSGFVVRQQNFGNPWEAHIDAVRAGGTWASVVPPVGAAVADWQLF